MYIMTLMAPSNFPAGPAASPAPSLCAALCGAAGRAPIRCGRWLAKSG